MVTLWRLKICIWNDPSGKYPEPSSPSRISDGSCFCSTADVARSASDSTESSHPRGPRAALYYCCHSLRTKPALRESSVNHAIPSEPAGNRVNKVIRSKVLSDKTLCLYKLAMFSNTTVLFYIKCKIPQDLFSPHLVKTMILKNI